MICYPNAKINLGLSVTAKRPDGYHQLETIMVPVAWSDVLEVKIVRGVSGRTCEVTGLINSVGKENSCTQAYDLLATDYQLPGVKMHLHKQIPTGAGLGGGSSDGAYCLKLLNKLCDLNISVNELKRYAATMGADNAFFIEEGAKWCTGIGDVMEPLPIRSEQWHLLLINPGVHISTAEAYSGIQPKPATVDLRQLWLEDISTWKKYMINDFEASVFSNYPELARLKEQLYDLGAVYASMSGSGSTLFALFSEVPKLPIFPRHYQLNQSEIKF